MAGSGRSINLMLAYLLHLTKGEGDREGETKWGRAGKNANIFHVGQVEWICWVSLAQNAKWSGSKEFHTMWIDQQEIPRSTSLSLPPYSVLAPFQLLLLLLLQTHVIVNDGGWANKPTNKQANKQCEAKPNEKREQGREKRREGREEREKNSQRKHNPNKPKNVQQHTEGAGSREREGEGEGERVLGAMSVRILTRKSHKLSVPRTNSLELL